MSCTCTIVRLAAVLLLIVAPASPFKYGFIGTGTLGTNRVHKKPQRRPCRWYLSSNESSSSTPAIRVREDAIATAASVVSYHCAEERLENALAYFTANLGDAASPPKISLDVRGQLEEYVDELDDIRHDNVVDLFLSALASTTRGTDELQVGLSVCKVLAQEGNNASAPLPFVPPSRSLVGTVDGMDVALLRDKEDVDTRFSMLFSVEKAKGSKIARLLAEIDNEGAVRIRGMHVQETHRRKGLATLLLAYFSQFCRVAFGTYPRTSFMNKPGMCVALESLGFVAENDKRPVFVAQSQEKDKKHVTLMMAAGDFELGPQFSHAVRRAQSIELVSHRPAQSRRVHVLTEFEPPGIGVDDVDHIENRLEKSTHTFYSARIVAFLATVGQCRAPMFRRSKSIS